MMPPRNLPHSPSFLACPTCKPGGGGAISLTLAAVLAWGSALPVQAQSSCASDGQPAPTVLLERFISADCESCWGAAQVTQPRPGELAIDWIVPSARGADAALSAAATRDALLRLQSLALAPPVSEQIHLGEVRTLSDSLRVAHGLAFNDYVGTSIDFQPARQQGLSTPPWAAWLLLVETIPAASEGSPIERNLVRNALQSFWNKDEVRSSTAPLSFREFRPMRIPDGARPRRLRVLGWVEDAQGRVIAAAQSHCIASH